MSYPSQGIQNPNVSVPTANSASNIYIADAIGNKTDIASETVNVASLIALSRKILSEAHEIERHLHNYERWIGPAAVASGEDHVADALGEVGGTPAGVITSFQLTSGANKTWGTAVQIWGATDSALILPTGRQAYFELHRLRIIDVQTNTHDWFLRIIAGASAAAGVSADTYGIIPLFVENTNKIVTPVELLDERMIAGTKLWIQLLHTSDNDAETMDLQFGVHGYPA